MPSPVFWFDGEDDGLKRAFQQARDSFRFFWRELAWEHRRIIPGLQLAAIKLPFWDVEGGPVEQMWVNEVHFDGVTVSGTLINAPNELSSIQHGDQVERPLNQISDWMYAMEGRVYGAWTVNLLRSRMGPEERAQHDEMWGLDFGDPERVLLCPQSWGVDPEVEHPMSENMAPAFEEQLSKNAEGLLGADASGWTLLHHQALAGSLATVKVLLAHGADPTAKTASGQTPADLARSLAWTQVLAVL